MWICLNDSFLSIVADPKDREHLWVRARFEGDIEAVFPRAHVVSGLPGRDYAYRTKLPRLEVANAIAARVGDIAYPNFKDSVRSDERHDVYLDLWRIMKKAQEFFRGRRPGSRAPARSPRRPATRRGPLDQD